jgi:hypothetical protein
MLTRRTLCLVAILAAFMPVSLWAKKTKQKALLPVLERFSQSVGKRPETQSFYRQARESLWEVYPQDDALKAELVEFVRKGADGPRLGFAGLALIPFHDPATVRPMLERATNPHTSASVRHSLLNAAPYVLGIGDAIYNGDGKLDNRSQEFASKLLKFGDQAAQFGLGHMHANTLRVLLSQPPAMRNAPDYVSQVSRTSAYLLGTLDARDPVVLAKAMSVGNRAVFQNVMVALSYASNRNFLVTFSSNRDEAISQNDQALGDQALTWWQSYFETHPNGSWDDAVMAGFRDAGYLVGRDVKSDQSQGELLRALDDPNPIIRYNAYRTFNRAYGTHFDLDIVFFAGKYAPSFMDVSSQKSVNETRLKQFWILGLRPRSPVRRPAAVPVVNSASTVIDGPTVISPVGAQRNIVSSPVAPVSTIVSSASGRDGTVMNSSPAPVITVASSPSNTDSTIVTSPAVTGRRLVTSPVGTDGKIVSSPVGTGSRIIGSTIGSSAAAAGSGESLGDAARRLRKHKKLAHKKHRRPPFKPVRSE